MSKPKQPQKKIKHEGNRTPDVQNRNLMLYPLSYEGLLKMEPDFIEIKFIMPLAYKYIYSGRKFGKYPYNTRPMESTPLLQPKSGI